MKVVDDEFGNQDVSAHASSLAAVESRELKSLFYRAVLGFYLRPGQIHRLLRNTPWSALARQGLGVFRLLAESAQ